ncbi:MAG: type II toxin-antitoxin system VapC family toxin [Gemmatimonadetes bacterium]|nr:type II toxin-antitoxin system VapC family toxin [Gemmatimonadota bacterium]
MVIDTSAVIAYLEREPEADRIEQRLLEADRLSISTATVVECGIVIEARRGDAGGRELDLLLHRLGVELVTVDERQTEIARSAWRRFGKGRHAAALNFGDCFSYALAQSTGQELLYIGDDFSLTDIRSAL